MSRKPQGEELNQDFRWTRLVPQWEEGMALNDDTFSMCLVQVHSDSDTGRWLHHDPVDFLRTNTDMGIPPSDPNVSDPEVRAIVLRVNAERPANPRHRSEVFMIIPGSTTIVGVQYKYPDEE